MTVESLNLKPVIAVREKVIVYPDDNNPTGMINLMEASKDNPISGTVVAVGKDVKEVKVGDKVFFSEYSGCFVTYDEIKYKSIPENLIDLVAR